MTFLNVFFFMLFKTVVLDTVLNRTVNPYTAVCVKIIPN